MEVSDIEKHYRANRNKLVKRMAFRSRSDNYAEDIVQEAYERALKYRKSCTPDQFDQWLNTILNNCLRDYRNVENGHPQDAPYEEDEEEGVACPSYSNQIMKEVYELIDTKPLIHQEILNLYFKQEYSAIDISRVTQHSYANCHKVVSRFRQELKELYGR